MFNKRNSRKDSTVVSKAELASVKKPKTRMITEDYVSKPNVIRNISVPTGSAQVY